MKIQEVEVQNLESLKLIDTQNARDKLLNDFDIEQNRQKNISFKTLLLVFVSVFLALAVLLPKVYISNQIYYNSKDINKMYHKYTALKEEREFLKRELEKLRYQTLSIEKID